MKQVNCCSDAGFTAFFFFFSLKVHSVRRPLSFTRVYIVKPFLFSVLLFSCFYFYSYFFLVRVLVPIVIVILIILTLTPFLTLALILTLAVTLTLIIILIHTLILNLQTLTFALTTHARTVHPVWMVPTITHAHVQLDIREVTVKRVGLLFSFSCCDFIQLCFYYFILIILFNYFFCYSPC